MIKIAVITVLIALSLWGESLELSHEAGLYSEPIVLKASIDTGELLYSYSNTFSARSSRFPSSLKISKSRSISFAQKIGTEITPLGSYSYFINFDTQFKVVAISINKSYLYNKQRGIYSDGAYSYYDSTDVVDGAFLKNANFNKRWERKNFIEVFDENGERIVAQNTGLRIFGGMTRYYPEKSMRVVARKEYGKKRIKADLFENGMQKHREFLLRHSGNDYRKLRFKDAYATAVAAEVGLDVQASSPSHLFVNSEYWGIYNIRERISDHYLSAHYDVPRKSIDLLQGRRMLKEGSRRSYNQLLSYIRKHPVSSDKAYQEVKTKVDTDNFANFWIHQIFYANADVRGNIRWWRSDSLDGKFRWIVYDTDLGLFAGNARSNYLRNFTSPTKTFWYNPQWSTYLLRSLLRSDEFSTYFVNQSLYLLSTTLSSKHLVKKLDTFEELYAEEMGTHFSFRKKFQYNQGSYKKWQFHVGQVRKFVQLRPSFYQKHLVQKFKLRHPYTLRIRVNQVVGSAVSVNGNSIDSFPYRGVFYASNSVPITIAAALGYEKHERRRKVLKKSGAPDSLLVDVVIKALPHSSYPLIINEVALQEGVIEIYNQSDSAIDLLDWTITTAGAHSAKVSRFTPNQMALPDVTIDAKEYMLFASANGGGVQYADRITLPFKIGKKRDTLKIYDNSGALVDSIAYDLSKKRIALARSLPFATLGKVGYQWEEVDELTLGDDNSEYLRLKAAYDAKRAAYVQWAVIVGGLVLGILLILILGYYQRGKRKKNPKKNQK